MVTKRKNTVAQYEPKLIISSIFSHFDVFEAVLSLLVFCDFILQLLDFEKNDRYSIVDNTWERFQYFNQLIIEKYRNQIKVVKCSLESL